VRGFATGGTGFIDDRVVVKPRQRVNDVVVLVGDPAVRAS
jgi:hypothetical protein